MVDPVAEAGLVGRASELDRLRRALAARSSGQGAIVVVSGEAGIGKSRLVAALLDEARALGLATLVGRADEIEADRPFGAIADAVGRSELSELVSVRHAVRPSEHPMLADRTVLVAEALVDGLEALAAETGGVVMVLEDLHWADAGTVAVLRRAPRLVQLHPVVVVVTRRSAPARRDVELVLDELHREGAEEIVLGPLADDAIDALVAGHLGHRPAEQLRAYLAGCAGNPFYLIELIAALDADGSLVADADADGVELAAGRGGVPPSLRSALVRRLGFLPSPTVRLLQRAALMGRTFSLRDVAAIAGSEPHELVDPLEAARRAELIDATDDRWEFRHDLVRHALVDDLAPPARKALHHAAAQALAASGAPTADVARQYALGAEPGDTEAIAALRRAAVDALGASVPVGIELLETAMNLAGDDRLVRAELAAALLDPLDAIGRHDDAERLAREVLSHPVPTELELPLRRGWALSLAGTGNTGGALEALDDLIRRPETTGSQRAVAHATGAVIQFVALDVEGATRRVASARAAIDGSGDVDAAAFTESVAALAAVAEGRSSEALALLESPDVTEPERSGHRWAGYNVPITSGLALLACDDFDTAAQHLAAFEDELGSTGSLRWHVLAAAIGTLLPYLAGDLDAAEASCEAALSNPVEYGPRLQAGVPLALLALVAWRRGDLDRAERYAIAVDEHYRRRPPELGLELAALAASLVQEARGDPEGAFRRLARAWEITAPVRHHVSDRIVGPELARLAVERQPLLAVAVADDLEEGARRNPAPSALGAAALCRGLVTGNADQLVEAVEHYRRSPRTLDLARAAGHAARALRAAGRRRAASRHLELARSIYSGAGADGDLDRLPRIAGVRRLGDAPRPTFGWASLTPTEQHVVALVGRGMTNRQIGEELGISRRTVETHLAHVFTKVGVATRVELAVGAAALA